MGTSTPIVITDCRGFFAEPATARQRQYEALRAFFLDGLTSKEVAHRFGYSHGAFRVLCHDFRRGLLRVNSLRKARAAMRCERCASATTRSTTSAERSRSKESY